MKKQLILLSLISVLCSLTSSMAAGKKDKFVKYDESLYISKYELTNLEYNIFLKDIKSNEKEEKIKKYMPDSTLWSDKFEYMNNAPYTMMYHWHPSYDSYPIVNITKEAIEYYCTWRTNKYNSDPNREYKKVIFRLPSETEWKKCSSPLPDHRLPWYGNFPYEVDKNNQIIPLANLKFKDYVTDRYNYVQDGALITVAVGNYKENNIGIYDIIGNVAEITSDGKVKGGSWANTLDESLIDKNQNYSLPDPRVGFRLVMEIIEK